MTCSAVWSVFCNECGAWVGEEATRKQANGLAKRAGFKSYSDGSGYRKHKCRLCNGTAIPVQCILDGYPCKAVSECREFPACDFATGRLQRLQGKQEATDET